MRQGSLQGGQSGIQGAFPIGSPPTKEPSGSVGTPLRPVVEAPLSGGGAPSARAKAVGMEKLQFRMPKKKPGLM